MIELVTPEDPQFPREFEIIEDPLTLHCRGTLRSEERRIAIVGTRSVDFEGQRIAKRISGDLARRGITIVSGGAIGVDTIAHRAAVVARRRTVVFLPSSLDRLTPRRNEALFDQIVECGGALVTEYPPGTAARRYHFHRRNRLIAAYSDAVLVIRSKARGGTMITARAAREIGRPLFVVPGSPEDRTSDGCNALIREGARCVRNAGDVLDDMSWTGPLANESQQLSLPAVSEDAELLLAVIEAGATSTDEISRRASIGVARTSVALLELEVTGRISKLPGTNAYRLCR